tara:strand:+ start:1770 stop:2339 length:570 start_codon:yes stop_codon:yes gene_type:complete
MDSKIIKSFNVTREMIIDRQYDIIEEETNTDSNYIIAKNQKNEKLIAYFVIEDTKKITPKIIVDLIKKLSKDHDLDENTNFIFVIAPKDHKLSDITEKLKNEVENNKVQLFHIKRLQFNITKHILSPTYIKLNESEVELLKKDYNLKNLAKIPITDPICKYYNMKINDIFKIIRKSNNAYQYNTYRIVI